MGVPEAVATAYASTMVDARALRDTVSATILEWMKDKPFTFRGRIKALESVSEKLETGRVQSWAELNDLFACTVVVPTLVDVEPTLEFLDSAFRKSAVKTRANTIKPPDVFRFDSARFTGRLRHEAGAVRAPGVGELEFEVQVVTAYEYACQVVTHSVAYKAADVGWQELRLAAYLRGLSEQADAMAIGFSEMTEFIPPSPYPQLKLRRAIEQYFKDLVDGGRVPRELVPASWSRFAENVHELLAHGREAGGGPRSEDTRWKRLKEAIEASVGGALPPGRSGSLFQFVVGVYQTLGWDDLGGRPLVPSRELRDLYGFVVPDGDAVALP